jgi:5-methylthioadenosine/S-adenosylhomocysteine deaminase
LSGPPYELAVRGGRFLTCGPDVPEGSTLLVRRGLIGGFAKPGEIFQAKRTIDASHRIVMPGLVNAHTHAAMSLFRGLADDLPLSAWLGRIWPAEAAAVSPEMVYWCSLLSCCEMLLSGTTLFGDSYFFEEEVARAAERAGVRAVCGQGVIDLAAPDAPAGQGLKRLRSYLENFSASALTRPAVFCHSVYGCSPETLAKAWELAGQFGRKFFIHLAETAAEVRECVRRRGVTPLRLLERLGLLSESCVLVHAVHLEKGETRLAAERGVAAVHCPESNMKLAAGIAPLGLLRRAGVRLALGSDSAASNNDLDMFREMGTAARLHRLAAPVDAAPGAAEIFWLATGAGAEVLGFECGVLEPGRLADLVILEPNQPHLWPEGPGAEQLVFCGRGADVRTVVVGGEVVVEERRLTRVDAAEVMARVRELAREAGLGGKG